MAHDSTADHPEMHRTYLGTLAGILLIVGALMGRAYTIEGSWLIPTFDPCSGLCDWRAVGRIAILIGAGLLGLIVVHRPEKPDSQVTRAATTAVGIIGLVTGLGDLVELLPLGKSLAALVLTSGGALFAYLGLRKSLWPRSQAMHEMQEAAMRHGASRRKKK